MIAVALIGVLALVTFVAAYLGSKYWHWGHVLVVVALFFSTVGFTILAADALNKRSTFQERAEKASAELQPLKEIHAALARGTNDSELINRLRSQGVEFEDDVETAPGLGDLRHQLRLVGRTSGRVWRNAQPLGPLDPQTGQISVGIEFPQPLGITQGAVLFGFEQGPANSSDPDQGRQYLAEFRVVSVAGQQLTLESVLSLDQRQGQRLLQSQGPWLLYEQMPGDRHDLFAEFTDDQLKQLLPASTVDEYLRDGTPWTVDDGQWVKEGRNDRGEIVGPDDWDDSTKFVYRRQLRDYAFIFNDLAKSRVEMLSKRQALVQDNQSLAATLESAKKLGAYRTDEQQKLRSDLAGVQADRKAIETHLANLQRQVQRGTALLNKTLAANIDLANRLATLQQAASGSPDLRLQPVPSRGAVDIDAL